MQPEFCDPKQSTGEECMSAPRLAIGPDWAISPKVILACVKISHVYRALTKTEPHSSTDTSCGVARLAQRRRTQHGRRSVIGVLS